MAYTLTRDDLWRALEGKDGADSRWLIGRACFPDLAQETIKALSQFTLNRAVETMVRKGDLRNAKSVLSDCRHIELFNTVIAAVRVALLFLRPRSNTRTHRNVMSPDAKVLYRCPTCQKGYRIFKPYQSTAPATRTKAR